MSSLEISRTSANYLMRKIGLTMDFEPYDRQFPAFCRMLIDGVLPVRFARSGVVLQAEKVFDIILETTTEAHDEMELL